MNLFDINPFIRYSNIHPFPIQNIKNKRSYDCRLFFVLEGEGEFYIENKEYEFCQNTTIILRGGVRYKYRYTPEKNVKFIIFNFDMTTENADKIKAVPVPFEELYEEEKNLDSVSLEYFNESIFIHNFASIKPQIIYINDLFINKPFFFQELASSVLKEVLIKSVQNIYFENNASNSDLIDNILAYIRNNYSKHITNNDIAMRYGYHSYYISKLVKNATGKSLHRYIIDYRLKIAKELLLTSGYSVDEIACYTGFGSTSQFSTAFKAKEGISPSKYRSANRNKLGSL